MFTKKQEKFAQKTAPVAKAKKKTKPVTTVKPAWQSVSDKMLGKPC